MPKSSSFIVSLLLVGLGTSQADARLQRFAHSVYDDEQYYFETLPVCRSGTIEAMSWKDVLKGVNNGEFRVPAPEDRFFTRTISGLNLSALPASGRLPLVDRDERLIGSVPFSINGDAIHVTVPLSRTAVVVPRAALTLQSQWRITTSFPIYVLRASSSNTILSAVGWRVPGMPSEWAYMTPIIVDCS